MLATITGGLAGEVELLGSSERGPLGIKVGQQLVVAASPFRHRTTKLALMGYETVAAGDQDRVVASYRRRVAEIKGGP